MILGESFLTAWTVVVFAVVMVFLQGVIKAYTDGARNDPKENPGRYWDRWHTIGRIDMWLDGLAWSLVAALALRVLGYPMWQIAAVLLPPVIAITWTGKRVFRWITSRFPNTAHWKYDR